MYTNSVYIVLRPLCLIDVLKFLLQLMSFALLGLYLFQSNAYRVGADGKHMIYTLCYNYYSYYYQHHYYYSKPQVLLGGSDGVVNSLDFCPASLKSFGCLYFRCVLSSQ